ncbi:MAG: GAF domain-containing sensor histidine kinase [Candidatus Parcubacteria bacterium]|nr:GAF domain-containing sensor histidine kinase [Candidatus Parcubacteria bacterium]
MDIRVIIKRSAVFTTIVLFITAIYAILAFILSLVFTDIFGVSSLILNGIVMAILVALGFEPLKKWLSEATDSFLFKAEYKPQEVLAEFSDRLSSTLDLDTLTQFITQKSLDVYKCTKVSLFLLDKKDNQYKEVSMAGMETKNTLNKIEPELFTKVFGYLHNQKIEKDIIVREEVRKNNEQLKNKVLEMLLAEMDKYEINLIVPMYSKNELIGIIFLGDKKSGDVYSGEDLRVLEIIAAQSAVAMENAQLFEEQKHFTEHLKIEVAKATKELKSANIQLKKLDEAKSEFISIASHQLRTPLTVIKGYLSMIQQKDFGEVPEKLANPLDRVFKSTLRIIGLVEDLLNVSRLESGRMKYDFEMVDITALATEVFEELEQHAKNKGLNFTFVKPLKKIPELKVDRNKVREVFMNLMDNSIKYTEKGFVTVKLEKMDGNVRFGVSDSGRGIAPDEMPQLFQKFSRAKGVQLVHTEGTGLGLYIAKKILQKHHAKIWAESEGAGKGSSFIIEFKVSKE